MTTADEQLAAMRERAEKDALKAERKVLAAALGELPGLQPSAIADAESLAESGRFFFDKKTGALHRTRKDGTLGKPAIEWLRTNKPHLFAAAINATTPEFDKAAAEAAFGATPSLAAQGKFFTQYGADAAAQIAALYGTKIGSLKPGKLAAPPKPGERIDTSSNPWARNDRFVGKDGRYSAAALTEQGRLVKTLGVIKAAEIAAAVGSKLGDVRPR